MLSIIKTYVLIVAFLLIAPIISKACSCIGSGAPCQAYWNTEAVFTGQVTEIADVPAKSATVDMSRLRDSFPKRTIRFAVSEAFRGISGDSVEVMTGRGGGDCGYNFEKGQNYLVYAYKNLETGELGTGICSRTALLSRATEDLEYFRGLKDAKPGATVYGVVMKRFVRKTDEPYRENVPVANVALTIEGNNNSYETKTDEKGEFRLTGLAAGDYEIRLKTPADLWGYEEQRKIKVFDKGCAGSYFQLVTKTVLSGKVTDENGKPASKIMVNLVAAGQIDDSHQKDHYFVESGEDGNFTFRSIPSGNYYLGVRLNRLSDTLFPYPRAFYPGTVNLEKVVPITISDGQILENINFKLPEKLLTRKIEGAVLMPDGTPVPNASVCIEEVEYADSSICQSGIETDKEGRFTFTAMSGLRYLLRSYISTGDGQQSHAEPFEVPAKGDIKNVKLIITEPNGSCEKCRRWTRNKK